MSDISPIKRIRMVVERWDGSFVYGRNAETPGEERLKVKYAGDTDTVFAGLREQLYEGATLNLLSARLVRTGGEEAVEYPCTLQPELLVLEPDFLMDITALCACIRPYGHSPYIHLLDKFTPPARSAAIQLGNAANQFLDDCVNEHADGLTEDELYLRSMQNSFRASPLAYSTLTDIGRDFFDQCRKQFHHIRQTVQSHFGEARIDIRSTEVQLEPSFLCEALGLQGRMDLLTQDAHELIELKSGRAEEYPRRAPREEHRLQMALYKEILHYNLDLPYEEVRSYLFYSRYPQMYAIDVPRDDIRRAIALRNDIIHLERRLRDGDSRKVLEELTEERINVTGRQDRFYQQYLRPRILEVLTPLHRMEGTEAAYFHRFLNFMEREQFLAKTGDGPAGRSGGFAAAWRDGTAAKQEEGNILTGLRLHPVCDGEGAVTGLELEMPDYGEDFLPNFREGDMVMLYEHEHEADTPASQQYFRCVVENISPTQATLKLSYKQRHADVFHTERHYAIEPGYMDATFNQAYAGLFGLLTAPRRRKELLLGQREPEADPSVRLNLRHGNEETDRIVLQAKQARDYFLLVGPPGTGKTSVALKAMVEEFLSDDPPKTLLLMAYTNRAVDEICGMLSTLRPVPEYVRIGQELNCAPAYRPRLMKNVIARAASRRAIYETLAPIRVFTGTISSLCGQTELFNLKVFDVALVDEASQVLEPQLLPLLCATSRANRGDYTLHPCAIGKFILIGDHKQLPAVVVQPPSASRVDEEELHAIGLTDCRNSLFERLHRLSRTRGTEGIVAMLHRQGRMHPDISAFVNHAFYGGRLDIVPVRHQLEALPPAPRQDAWTTFISSTRMGFVAVKAERQSAHLKSNRREAETVARIIHTITALHPDFPLSETGKHIGIIVPFRAQIAMIRKALAAADIPGGGDITIDTVERYQGSQRDIIIFSTTVSRPDQLPVLSEPAMTEGQVVDRKLNVAVTRARQQFFMVGDEELLRQCEAYRDFLDFLKDGQIFR